MARQDAAALIAKPSAKSWAPCPGRADGARWLGVDGGRIARRATLLRAALALSDLPRPGAVRQKWGALRTVITLGAPVGGRPMARATQAGDGGIFDRIYPHR